MEKKRTRTFNKTYAVQLAAIFSAFVIFGFSENIKGPAIPRIQFDFLLSESQLGTLLSLNALGYLLACSFTAILVKKWGVKAVTIMALASMALSGVFIFASHHYTMFSASYFLMYIGNGMLEIALAVLGARIFVRNTGTMMNLSHGFYGLSSVFAPLIASGLMEVTINDTMLDWRGMYLVMLLLSLVPILFLAPGKFPGNDTGQEGHIPFKTFLKDPVLWMMVLILTFGVVSELAVGGWLVNFLEKAYEWNTVEASGLLSAFFLFFTGARLLLGPLTDKLGFTLSLIIFSFSSAACTVLALVLGEKYAILFAVSGAGIAMVYPTVMAFIARRYPRGSDTAITITVTLMGLGSVIGNYLIGAVIELVKSFYKEDAALGLVRGLQAGYAFIGLCAALSAISGIVLYMYLSKRKEVI